MVFPLTDDQSGGAREGMRWLTGGAFHMGSDRFYPEEAPVRPVVVDSFWIDETPVTNQQFAAFVAETGYVTLAEQAPDPVDYPEVLPEALVAGSLVFTPTEGPVDLGDPTQWWTYRSGANWRRPEGRDSTIIDRLDHPVIHIAHADALAYAHWAGKDLPTEAEWEFAARAGLSDADYAWGDELTPDGVHLANTWQGAFPHQNLKDDGYAGTSPVRHYPPNAYGLYDLIGDVWEWTLDAWSQPGPAARPCCAPRNPRVIADNPQRVIKGGSHLCAPNYCQRYRPAARTAQSIDTSTSHIGFRCVRRSHPLQERIHD